MHIYKFYNTIDVKISDEDWDFLCKNRWFTENPDYEDVRLEFSTGTQITIQDKELWDKASEEFHEYICDLMEIQKIDINSVARKTLSFDEKYIKNR